MKKFGFISIVLTAVLLAGTAVYAQEVPDSVSFAEDAAVQEHGVIQEPEDWAAAFIDFLGKEQFEILKVRDLFEGTDTALYGIMIEDVTGDGIPELIYPTVESASGSEMLTMFEKLEYTQKAVMHIAAYDAQSASVIGILEQDAVCADDQGNYTCFGSYPDSYYTVKDSKGLYRRLIANLSGTAVGVEQYSYDDASKSFEKVSEILVEPSGMQESDIPNIYMKNVYQQNSYAKLLFDSYGNTDYRKMSFEEALEYLRSRAYAAAKEEAVISSVQTGGEIVLPEGLEPYKAAYAAFLLNFMPFIDLQAEGSGSASERNVSLQDVFGDETPELLFLMSDGTNPGSGGLYIVTFEEGNLVVLFKSDWKQMQSADSWYFYLFRRQNEDTLYIYKDFTEKGIMDEVFSYVDFGLETEEKVLYEKIDHYASGATEPEYYRYYAPVTEGEYLMLTDSCTQNISDILMIGFDGRDYDENYVGETANRAVTCEEAINLLTGQE